MRICYPCCMRQQVFLLQLDQIPIYRQLQIEEALLRSDQRNWCILNQGASPAIVMGISGKANLLLNQKLLAEQPIPVIRRFSGGGTVVIDEQTIFATFIFNAKDIQVGCCPQKVMQWTGEIYQPLLCGIDFQLKENDYAIGDKKFGGNAQYLCKNRWLHHSSLLWNFSLANMDYLLMPQKYPAYRQSRKHADFLCKLSHYFQSPVQVTKHIIQQVSQRFNIEEVCLDDILEVLERPHRKATAILECGDLAP
jgi:lipoate-protein ligase A